MGAVAVVELAPSTEPAKGPRPWATTANIRRAAVSEAAARPPRPARLSAVPTPPPPRTLPEVKLRA